MKNSQRGSVEVLVILVIVIIVAAAGFFVFTRSNSDSESTNNTETSENDTPEQSSPKSETVSTGEYTISNINDLAPVCASASFPSGLTSSQSGTLTAVLSDAQEKGSFEAVSATFLSSSYSAGFSSTEIDRITCVKQTDVVAFEKECTINGTSFNYAGKKLDVTIYNAQTKEVLKTGSVNNSDECPRIATIGENNTVTSVNVDRDALGELITSL